MIIEKIRKNRKTLTIVNSFLALGIAAQESMAMDKVARAATHVSSGYSLIARMDIYDSARETKINLVHASTPFYSPSVFIRKNNEANQVSIRFMESPALPSYGSLLSSVTATSICRDEQKIKWDSWKKNREGAGFYNYGLAVQWDIEEIKGEQGHKYMNELSQYFGLPLHMESIFVSYLSQNLSKFNFGSSLEGFEITEVVKFYENEERKGSNTRLTCMNLEGIEANLYMDINGDDSILFHTYDKQNPLGILNPLLTALSQKAGHCPTVQRNMVYWMRLPHEYTSLNIYPASEDIQKEIFDFLKIKNPIHYRTPEAKM